VPNALTREPLDRGGIRGPVAVFVRLHMNGGFSRPTLDELLESDRKRLASTDGD
jgi:hypothetical protein